MRSQRPWRVVAGVEARGLTLRLLDPVPLPFLSQPHSTALTSPKRYGNRYEDGSMGRGNELRRMSLPRTPVNKAFSDAAVFGRCHHAECERWLGNQKRRRKETSSYVLRRKQADRAELARST